MNVSLKCCLPSGLVWLLMSVAIVASSVARAQDILALERSHDVELLAWVGKPVKEPNRSKAPQFSVNEQVILYIEVATPRWFTGGTRIGSIEIPNVITKQRNQLATNYTEKKLGKTWSRQRWEVTLYPQSSGKFVVPSIPVGVQVSAPNGEKVTGTLYTKPIHFLASVPSGLLSDNTPWFTATDVKLKQNWSKSHEDLKVGDVITRSVAIDVKDSLSVLLPELLSKQATSQYQIYSKPNALTDTQTRGNYQSSRIEEVVYVLQQGGEVRIPEYRFQWWNSKTKQLETEVVAGKTFTVKHTLKSFLLAYAWWLWASVTLISAIIIAAITARRYYRAHPMPSWWVFHKTLRQQHWAVARTLLYKHLWIKTNKLELTKADSSDNWQTLSGRLQDGYQDKRLFKSLWKAISRMKPTRLRLVFPKALPKLSQKIVSHRDDE